MSRALRTILPTLLSVLLLLMGLGAPAQAHDELTGSDPADGATLDAAPEAVTLTFTRDLSGGLGTQVVVSGPSGDALADGETSVDGNVVRQDLVDLGPGSYTVLWRVTSQDGHPISGELSFTVAAGQDDPAEEPGTQETAAEETTAAEPAEDTAAGETSAAEDTVVDVAEESEKATGLPLWVWIFLAVAVVGLGALLLRTWTRGRT